LASFINSLIDQNAELAGKVQNLDSLTELIEKTVIEAGTEAEIIKKEAEKEANARAASIIASAEENAKKIITAANEKTEAEVRRIMAEARRIVAGAEKSAEESVREKLLLAEQQARDILKAAEEKGSLIIEEAQKKTEGVAQLISKQAEQLLSSKQKTGGCQATRDPWDVPDELFYQPEGTRETKAVSMTEKKPPEPPVSNAAVSVAPAALVEKPLEQPSPGKKEEDKKGSPASYDDYDGTVELALSPPVALDRMLKLHKHLNKDSRVKIVNLKGSLHKGVRMKLLVQAHTPLMSILMDLPEVEKVSYELIEAGNVSSAHRKGNGAHPRTIAVTMKK
jgi:F0F1-type ATP synthase membrane subunit b/b'